MSSVAGDVVLRGDGRFDSAQFSRCSKCRVAYQAVLLLVLISM